MHLMVVFAHTFSARTGLVAYVGVFTAMAWHLWKENKKSNDPGLTGSGFITRIGYAVHPSFSAIEWGFAL